MRRIIWQKMLMFLAFAVINTAVYYLILVMSSDIVSLILVAVVGLLEGWSIGLCVRAIFNTVDRIIFEEHIHEREHTMKWHDGPYSFYYLAASMPFTRSLYFIHHHHHLHYLFPRLFHYVFIQSLFIRAVYFLDLFPYAVYFQLDRTPGTLKGDTLVGIPYFTTYALIYLVLPIVDFFCLYFESSSVYDTRFHHHIRQSRIKTV